MRAKYKVGRRSIYLEVLMVSTYSHLLMLSLVGTDLRRRGRIMPKGYEKCGDAIKEDLLKKGMSRGEGRQGSQKNCCCYVEQKTSWIILLPGSIRKK